MRLKPHKPKIGVSILVVMGLTLSTIAQPPATSLASPASQEDARQAIASVLASAVQVSAGFYHSCALTTSNGLQCWGINDYGQLGNGTTTDSSTPINVIGLETGISAISLGRGHSCALTIESGVKCWGNNAYGQLGNGTKNNSSTPTNVIGLETGVAAISLGSYHSCALIIGGEVKCWGGNAYGQLGNGTTTDSLLPVNVTGLSSLVTALSAKGDHACVITAGQDAKCWGQNESGQLGDGTLTNRSVPVDVVGLSNSVAKIVSSRYHSCAITNDKNAKCWGSNLSGELGDGTTNQRLTPVDVIGLSNNVLSISTTGWSTCALISSGQVKCWGWNYHGQLGDGTTTDKHLPIDVIGFDTNVVEISAGDDHVCALTITKSIKCWGLNDTGQVGDGTRTDRYIPVNVLGFQSLTSTPTNTSSPTPSITPTKTPTSLPTSTSTSTPTKTTTPTQTKTPLPTWTNTPTIPPTSLPALTSTATPTREPTATAVPGLGDSYEPDDTCASARAISTDGTIQQHTFHQYGDEDWVQMAVISGSTYAIEGAVQQGSPVNLVLEIYGPCTGAPSGQNPTFSPGVHLEFKAPYSGLFNFRLLNASPGTYGPNAAYTLSTRDMSAPASVGAVIIVGGRSNDNDDLQRNINSVTDRIYRLFQRYRYTDNDIYYMATDSSLPGWDAMPSVAALHNAITTWAAGRVGADRALTLYLVDHGWPEMFYLDGDTQILTPNLLDSWLTELETIHPGVKINVVMEACYSGSFISRPNSISKNNRVIVTSARGDEQAYATYDGAIFSDFFINNLDRGATVFNAFTNANWAVRTLYSLQSPQLDDNGDGISDINDGQEAMRRGLGLPGSFDNAYNWPPYIAEVQVQSDVLPNRRIIRAQVLDDAAVETVYAVIYPPSYAPPSGGERLITDTLQTVVLAPQGNNWYAASYPGFDEKGSYKIVAYAQDYLGALAQPVQIISGSAVYLPMLWR